MRLRQRIFTSVVAAGLLLWFWLAYVVPYPSFRRTAVIRNATTNDIRIACVTRDRKHTLDTTLPPGGSLNFVFFVGDRGGAKNGTIGALLLVSNLQSGQYARRDLQFSVGDPAPTIQLSNDWFATTRTQ